MLILEELQAGRDRLINDIAGELGVHVQTLAKSLSPLGVRAQKTKRQGVAGRYFTSTMISQIEQILKESSNDHLSE